MSSSTPETSREAKPKAQAKTQNTNKTQSETKPEGEIKQKKQAVTLSQSLKKQFRTIGHKLNPVVTIGDSGLSANVKKELDRALEDHELIKVKVPAGERAEKTKLIDALCKSSQCTLVQKVGNMILVYRAAKKPNPKLSNIIKNQGL